VFENAFCIGVWDEDFQERFGFGVGAFAGCSVVWTGLSEQ
jgi:hypothetical protein